MKARTPPAALALFTCFIALTGEATAQAGLDRAFEPTPEAAYSEASLPHPRLHRALKKADPQYPLTGEAERTLLAYAAFVELLPLEQVESLECRGNVINITFDAGDCKYLYLELPDREEWLLDRKHDDLRGGRPKLGRIRGHKLRIRDQLQIRIRDGEIESIREGDIEAVCGLFKIDIELSTHVLLARVARDDHDQILLERDEQGRAARANGEWIPQRFDRWVRVEARSREYWIGVPAPRTEERILYVGGAGL